METIKKNWRVAIRLADWAQGYTHRIFDGIQECIRQGNPMTLDFNQPSGGDLRPVVIDQHWRGDGVIIFRPSEQEIKTWRQNGIYGVNLSAEPPKHGIGFPQVTLDNVRAGEMAAEHFVNLGLNRFIFLHDSNRRYSMERLQGYESYLNQAGYSVEVIDIPASTFPSKTRAAQFEDTLWKKLSVAEAPCGLFAKDDISAVVALRVLQKIGFSVPSDFAVLGVDNDLVFCLTTQPPLSSIQYPGKNIGLEAARCLIHQMTQNNDLSGERILVTPQLLVRRESSGRVNLQNPIVAKALYIIDERIRASNLTSAELASLVGVSRESLRLHFHSTLGRSPKEEIDRLRAEYIGELLRRTNWKIAKIAEIAGFSGADELCRFFKRTKGMTVGDWRKPKGQIS